MTAEQRFYELRGSHYDLQLGDSWGGIVVLISELLEQAADEGRCDQLQRGDLFCRLAMSKTSMPRAAYDAEFSREQCRFLAGLLHRYLEHHCEGFYMDLGPGMRNIDVSDAQLKQVARFFTENTQATFGRLV